MPITLHMLVAGAPPMQVTRDLASFLGQRLTRVKGRTERPHPRPTIGRGRTRMVAERRPRRPRPPLHAMTVEKSAKTPSQVLRLTWIAWRGKWSNDKFEILPYRANQFDSHQGNHRSVIKSRSFT